MSDAAAIHLGYLDAAGALTDKGRAYVDEILEKLGIPERVKRQGCDWSEMGRLSAAKRAGNQAIALDVARRTNSVA